ncbi:MAG TPA: hypothetical protein P5160_04905 [Candidatus Omnitrophota bacterium]|nr:hypothetical protein [Candidatus Omnitrophota bacterium]
MARKGKSELFQYRLDEQGHCVLQGYNRAKPFSNFFPGIAGLWGAPMWVFYVNRGQCISSFGIESKDRAMLEFLPANKAYRQTPLQGFRTFLKIKKSGKTFYWEPFQNGGTAQSSAEQVLSMTSYDLTIEDRHGPSGLRCRVNYFTVPEENFASLVRVVTLQNDSKTDLAVEAVDGLPVFLPYGMNDWLTKNMCRTVEAWVKVRNLEQRAPYYQLNVEVSDTPDVRHIRAGNFYFAFEEGRKGLLPAIAQAECVFGQATDFVTPKRFLETDVFKVPSVQQTSNRTPCAMVFKKGTVASKKTAAIISVMGHAHSLEHLESIVGRVTEKGYIKKKCLQNRDIVAGVKNYALTSSARPVFDQYAAQTFLDNVLRGGLPISLKTQDGPVAFNVFSRKHGDPERDYNYFLLSPTYFSQGNGNYRDVNQNRRNDIWFNTDVSDTSIFTFFSLSQADGYNPLVVKGMSFFPESPARLKKILHESLSGDLSALDPLMEKGFQPGELLAVVDKEGLKLKVSHEKFLSQVLSVCHKQTLADHGEGFWVDHWTYNIDLIESYLAIFPDHLKRILLEKKEVSFYHNDHYVLPRDQRYILTERGVRQYHSVMDGSKSIPAKAGRHLLRVSDGEGDVYYTSLAAKMLCLIANKAATFDPAGIGIEMEADKPGWYDALNGLPGLLGSSTSEMFELRRYAQFLLDAFNELGLDDYYEVSLFDELGEFIKRLSEILEKEQEPLAYWRAANDVKESYRLSVRKGIRGDEEGISVGNLRTFLQRVIDRTHMAENRAKQKNGLVATYYMFEVLSYEHLPQSHDGKQNVMPTLFKASALPLFLEGIVHMLKVTRDLYEAKKIYHAVRQSGLFDQKLKMYKVNEDLSAQNEDIGRARVFPRGWLENESIWLHMEYKYILELLRVGLYQEFVETFDDVLVPFLDPAVYGRSTLENSSFLVSSAHEDESLHGQGFVARLSGSTAEMLHIWLWMNIGQNPFVVNHQKQLCLQFDPTLSRALFISSPQTFGRINRAGRWEDVKLPAHTYAFHFLASTLVVYHNPKSLDIRPDSDYQVERIVLTLSNGQEHVFTDGFIPAPHAQRVREGGADRIDVHFV